MSSLKNFAVVWRLVSLVGDAADTLISSIYAMRVILLLSLNFWNWYPATDGIATWGE